MIRTGRAGVSISMTSSRVIACLTILTSTACFDPAPDVGSNDEDPTSGSTSSAATLPGSSSGSSGPGVDSDSSETGTLPDGTTGSTSTGEVAPAGTDSSTGGDDDDSSTGETTGSTGVVDTSRVAFLLPYMGAPMAYEGLEGADQHCQTSAEAAGLEGTFMAWLSAGSTAQVVDRFSVEGGPFVLVDGTHVATDWADLTDGSLAAPILVDASGVVYDAGGVPERYVITHTAADGTSAPGVAPCSGFTGNSVVEAGWGNAGNTDGSWTHSDDRWQCDSDSGGGPSLYCFQQ